MDKHSPVAREADLPTRWQAWVFAAKAWVFRLQRSLRPAPPRLERGPVDPEVPVREEVRASLYASGTPAEFRLQAGKVQNLRVAAKCLDGLLVPRDATFSFWRHVPRPTRASRFAQGRELREGCLIPSVGGGLCQLSNLLYDAASRAGYEIVERHAHSRPLPGSMAAAGRDATVFWNYVDLRFRPPADCQLEVKLTRDELIVRLRARSSAPARVEIPADLALGPPVESCETCGITTCFRHPGRDETRENGAAAWLLDAWWPEFDDYLQQNRQPIDWLFVPLDGARRRIASYRWSTEGVAKVREAPLETLRRSWRSRRLASQGAERQQALLAFDEGLARRYARGLPPEATHLVVSQNLLPFLWRNGALGGRTFDVLMTRLPLAQLQATLDRAAALHPQSLTLADFRADPALLADETAALAEARLWITPHAGIARLAGPCAVRLPWHMPPAAVRPPAGSDIFFPASTLGRKGAYELREAARQLGLRVRLGGPVLEDANFWQGIDASPAADRGWAGVAAAVLPAWVENQPRRLLAAIAAGIPVIASDACGLHGLAGVTIVPEGDVEALVAALRQALPGGCDPVLRSSNR